MVVEDEQGEDGTTWVLDIEQVSAVESHFIARVKSQVTVATVWLVVAGVDDNADGVRSMA